MEINGDLDTQKDDIYLMRARYPLHRIVMNLQIITCGTTIINVIIQEK